MPNDIVVQSDKNGGKVHLSADRVYDLNKNKTQDAINAEFEPLMQLDSEVAIVIDGRSCTLGAVSGQYVILQNSTIAGKSDGLYTVATGKTIPIGATNVTADMLANPIPRGGLNHLSASVKNTLNSFEEEMVIVVDGNQATMQIADQQLILLKNSTISGKTDGLYRATQLIPQGTTITAAYLSNPITIGGLNEIERNFWGKIELAAINPTYNSTYVEDTSNFFIRSFGNVVCLNGAIKLKSEAYTGYHTIATIPSGKRPISVVRAPCELADQAYNPGILGYVAIDANGGLSVSPPSGNTRPWVYFSISYIAQI